MVAGHLRIQNGIYQMVIETTDLNGKRKSISRTTGLNAKGNKKKAEAMLLEYRNTYSKEAIVSLAPKMDFADYMIEWLNMKKDNIATTTYAGYQHNICKRIVPYFMEHKVLLMDIRPHHLQSFYRNMQETYGVKNKTLLKYHANIRTALEYALKKELLLSNIADLVERPQTEIFYANFYNEQELKQLFEAFENDSLELIVKLAACLGLRREEVLGLKWSAIDFVRKTLVIQNVIVQCSVDGKRQVFIKDRTKTKSSYRTLPLPENIAASLAALHQQQMYNKKLMPNLYDEYSDYVCIDAAGKLIRPDYVSQHYRLILKKKGLRKIRFHDLRHSCASYLYSQGVPIKNIQEWLGHA